MKILFISYTYWPPDFGGELLASIERFHGLVCRGHSVLALTSGRPGFSSRAHDEGIEVLRSPRVGSGRAARGLRRLVFVVWALYRLLRLQYDVVHLGSLPGIGPRSNALIGWLFATTARARKAKTFWVHSLAESDSEPLIFSGVLGLLRRRFVRSLTGMVAVSPVLYTSVQRVASRRAFLIPYGVRDDIFVPLSTPERQQVREKYGLNTTDLVFTFVGSVTYRKGFDLLAEAFVEVSSRYSHSKLIVIGPRSHTENQNLLEEEFISVTQRVMDNENVLFLGRIDDRQELARLLAASDILVFPSRREGFGLAPVEAMAAGVPPIIARIPGVTDLANVDGETGAYVTPGDLADLAQAMEALGGDPELRHDMAVRARARVKEHFGWEQHLDRWEQLYAGSHVSLEHS